jgi:hypothetical protein
MVMDGNGDEFVRGSFSSVSEVVGSSSARMFLGCFRTALGTICTMDFDYFDWATSFRGQTCNMDIVHRGFSTASCSAASVWPWASRQRWLKTAQKFCEILTIYIHLSISTQMIYHGSDFIVFFLPGLLRGFAPMGPAPHGLGIQKLPGAPSSLGAPTSLVSQVLCMNSGGHFGSAALIL